MAMDQEDGKSNIYFQAAPSWHGEGPGGSLLAYSLEIVRNYSPSRINFVQKCKIRVWKRLLWKNV